VSRANSGWLAAEISLGHKEVPVSHLRKMMLEELQRRNYAETTTRCYIAQSKNLLDDSTVRRTVWAPGTFVNIRPSCFRSGSCRRAPLRNVWRLCGSSTARTLKKALEHRGDALSEEAFHLPTILSQEEVARLSTRHARLAIALC